MRACAIGSRNALPNHWRSVEYTHQAMRMCAELFANETDHPFREHSPMPELQTKSSSLELKATLSLVSLNLLF
jgi:hypothetical protein